MTYFQGNVFAKMRINVNNSLFSFYIKAPYEFHITRNPSQLIRNITSQGKNAISCIQHVITVIKETVIMLMIFALLLVIDPQISFLIFSLLLLFSITFFLLSKKGSKERGKIIMKFWEKQIKTLNHGLGTIKEIKILNKEKFIFDIFKTNTDLLEKSIFFQWFVTKLPRLFLEVVAITSIVAVSLSFVFLDRPIENLIPLIALIAASAARLIPCFSAITTSIATLKYRSPALKLIAREISNMEEVNFSKHNLYTPQNENKINSFKNLLEVKNLIYYYPNANKRAIDNISFNIHYGDVVGVIGRSGAGKSTLVDILAGILNPSEGKILVDGINIKKFLKNWQGQIGYVPQDIYLLDDTIKANIAFGVLNNEINQEYLSSAIELAQLKEFIDTLPEKENTIVGDRGTRLSSGQRQRIGIARALYYRPKILIFDEPTSALDFENEKKIMKDLYSLGGKLTIIIISHRYTALEGCKKILNLHNGKIDEIINYNDFLIREEKISKKAFNEQHQQK